MLSYEGIFFSDEVEKFIYSIDTNKLNEVNDKLHCTFKYNPLDDEIFNDIVGKKFTLYLIGYGNDGMNSGFEVMFPDELKKYYINYNEESPFELKIPHITVSFSNDSEATGTSNLDFKLLAKPIKIEGKFGYWIKDEKGEYLSFEPYIKKK